MIKTMIEWHRTSDQLPDDDTLVIASDNDGDTFAAFVDGDAWRYADAIPAPTPEFWTHFPAGPVPPRWKEPEQEPVAPARCALTPAQEAAPELLEALRDALELIETICPIEGHVVRAARAAIDKATGGKDE